MDYSAYVEIAKKIWAALANNPPKQEEAPPTGAGAGGAMGTRTEAGGMSPTAQRAAGDAARLAQTTTGGGGSEARAATGTGGGAGGMDVKTLQAGMAAEGSGAGKIAVQQMANAQSANQARLLEIMNRSRQPGIRSNQSGLFARRVR